MYTSYSMKTDFKRASVMCCFLCPIEKFQPVSISLQNTNGGQKLKCLPYFYQIGATKSGTTDLYRAVSLHPEIVMGSTKEFMYWNWKRLG